MQSLNTIKIGDIEINKDFNIMYIEDNKLFSTDNAFGREYRFSDSLSNKFDFLGEQFYVRMTFRKEKIYEIKLTPCFNESKYPGYPTEEFERDSFVYNCELLKKAYGEPNKESDTLIKYDSGDFLVYSNRVLNGREPYSGGTIIIKPKQ